MSKYKFNTSYNPREISQASALEKTREANRMVGRTTYEIDPSVFGKDNVKDYHYLNPEYKKQLEEEEIRQIDRTQALVNQQLDRFGGFTYDIPEEKYWNTRERYIDKDGVATSLDGKEKIGKAIVPNEFYEYVQKKMDRDEAQAFKEFMFGQMDMTDPVKKAYWMRNNTIYAQELMAGLQQNLVNQFTRDHILLHGPQTEKEWNYLYMNEFPAGKELYSQNLTVAKSKNLNALMPTTLPFPQGKLTGVIPPQHRQPYDITKMKV